MWHTAIPLGDTAVLLSRVGEGFFVMTEDSTYMGVSNEAVAALVDGSSNPPPPGSVGSWRIMQADDGEVWGLSLITRQDLASVRATLGRPSGSATLPAIRNAWMDGIVWRMTLGSAPDLALVIEDPALGFADDEHFYSYTETEDGLIQIQVYRFAVVCTGEPGL